jgi:hypothetical protein
VIYAVLSLTVVRMLPVAIVPVRTGAERPTVAFIGWFGPRGLASIVFAVLLVDEADLPHTQTLLVAIALTVAISVVAHGLTAAPSPACTSPGTGVGPSVHRPRSKAVRCSSTACGLSSGFRNRHPSARNGCVTQTERPGDGRPLYPAATRVSRTKGGR